MSSPSRKLVFMGIEVDFPYKEPYNAQRAIMAKAMASYVNMENALLESPTGTGKSLALLSSSLAYQEHIINTAPVPAMDSAQTPGSTQEATQEQENNIPRIFYTSRTHSQLKQVVSEIKKLRYHPKMSILASREQLCLNQSVLESGDVDRNCRLVHGQRHACPYGKDSSSIPKDFLPGGENELFDIEELTDYCREKTKCPYLLTRLMMAYANFVLCPYNYIIDGGIREAMRLNLSKSILIIDEAHNIESVCRDSGSMVATAPEVYRVFEHCHRFSADDISKELIGNEVFSAMQHLGVIFDRMRDWIFQKIDNIDPKSEYVVENDMSMILSGWGISTMSWPSVDLDMSVLLNASDSANPRREDSIVPDYVEFTLKKFARVFKYIFSNGNCNDVDFRLLIKPKPKDGDPELVILCMNPGVVFKPLSNLVHSVILSSGTLSPLEQFSGELGVSFKHQLRALHVIQPNQVRAFVVGMHNNTPITSVFYELKTKKREIFTAIGELMLEVLPTIPDGVLLFMQSHTGLRDLQQIWKDAGLLKKINVIKPVFFENQKKGKNGDVFSLYKNSISCGKAGILVGVCRGKMSEGIDFADAQARAVFVFGVPYPNFMDPDVRLKREYNQALTSGPSGRPNMPTGEQWYEAQALRSLFQAIGRCIRHVNDYGAIVFLDQRFSKLQSKFPKWISQSVSDARNTPAMKDDLSNFYSEMRTLYPDSGAPLLINSDNMSNIKCTACASTICILHRVQTGESSYVEFNSIIEATGCEKNEHLLRVKAKDNKEFNANVGDGVWYPSDGFVLDKITCACGITVGCKVICAKGPKMMYFDDYWLFVDKCHVSQGELSVPMSEIVQKPLVLTMKASADGQSLLSFTR